MTTENSGTDPVPSMNRGLLWIAIGGLLLVLVLYLRVYSPSPLWKYGPLVPMFIGAYLAVVGIEKLISGYSRGRRAEDAEIQARSRRTVVMGGSLVVVMTVAGVMAHQSRMPYLEATQAKWAAEEAVEKLGYINHDYATSLQGVTNGMEEIEAWGDASREGLKLRQTFVDALAGAEYLSLHATGVVQTQARVETEYFKIFVDWMDLYARIQKALNEESMAEPDPTWVMDLNDIVMSLEALTERGAVPQGHDHHNH